MRIVELDEKSARMKNKKFIFDLSKEEMQLVADIIKDKIKDIQEVIRKEEAEINIVYCKDNFDNLAAFNELYKIISESILRSSLFEVSYDYIDILWDSFEESLFVMSQKLRTYSRTFLKDTANRHCLLYQLMSKNEKEYKKALNKLYPKRKEIEELINDYVNESSYNGFFLDNNEIINLHIPMKEKENILAKINIRMYILLNEDIKNLTIEHNEMPVEIPFSDIERILHNVSKIISKDIYSGSVFQITIKDYCILNDVLNG